MIPCIETNEDRSSLQAAQSLVKQGSVAIPEIEKTLDSIEARDRQSDDVHDARLILQSYVRIKGQAAFARLQEMIDHANQPSLQLALDDAMSLLFGVTSFVSFREGKTALRINSIATCRAQEPRDGLDRFIVAWLGNDPAAVQDSLAWSARGALRVLLKGRSWQDLRAELWRGPANGRIAVGYKFETGNLYGEPGMDTVFHSGTGRECGRMRVKFAGVPVLPDWEEPRDYVVDTNDIGNLLRIVSMCATDSTRTP